MSITGWSEGRIRESLGPGKFEAVKFNSPDIYSENREYLRGHLFKTPDKAPRLIIYRRITPAEK
ncbi:MAG: hypothetical protein LLG37_08690 [Spirochaetia bacterium]|nr:hypothetical protein [Spirochaetia bacterium]